VSKNTVFMEHVLRRKGRTLYLIRSLDPDAPPYQLDWVDEEDTPNPGGKGPGLCLIDFEGPDELLEFTEGIIRARVRLQAAPQELAEMTEVRYPEPVLCYVDHRGFHREPTAWFTTRQLDHQWGDAWNENPYEGYAGKPWPYAFLNATCGVEPWKLASVGFEAPSLKFAEDWPERGRRSVKAINQGTIPWLFGWPRGENPVKIYAGCPLREFKRLVTQAGGTIDEPEQWIFRQR